MDFPNGLRPLQPDARDKRYNFVRRFGATALSNLPERFTIDAGLTMPDQLGDNAPTECTAYTVTDLATDQDGVVYTPDYTYAMTMRVAGLPPETQGADLRSAMESAIAYGLLPKTDAPFSAREKGQVYVADWKRWLTYVEKAQKNAKPAYWWVSDDVFDHFDDIRSAIYTAYTSLGEKRGVMFGIPWFSIWGNIGRDGIAHIPTGVNPYVQNWHAVAVKGWTTTNTKGRPIRNGETFLQVKIWGGRGYGDNGWVYFDRELVNYLSTIEGVGKVLMAQKGNRLWSLFGILVKNFPQLVSMLPNFYKLAFPTQKI